MTDEEILKELNDGCLDCHVPWMWCQGKPFCPNCLNTPTPAVPKES